MKLFCESNNLNDYLIELPEVNFSNSIIQPKVKELFHPSQNEIEKAKVAFEFVLTKIICNM